MSCTDVSRLLIIDDNVLIHDDFRKVLTDVSSESASLDDLETMIFGDAAELPRQRYKLDFACQGEEAVAMARRAIEEGDPYRLAFVDMRMPPGWDGLRTMIELRKLDACLQFVVCSAYSDYDQQTVTQRLGIQGGMLHLAKPFSPDDIRQIAYVLAAQIERCA